MAVLNVTADSFSDGGRWAEKDQAVERGRALAAAGAALVDVGGESTRPGAEPVSAEDERARVVPVIAALAAAGVTVSVDTTKASVARAALAAGAVIVNDVSGGLADPGMLAVAREAGAGYVVTHWRGPLAADGSPADYGDVVEEVMADLATRLRAVERAGLPRDRIILDPGLGFSKSDADNWALVSRAEAWAARFALPVLWGASRKRFTAFGLPVDQRDPAAYAITSALAERGVWAVRVHEVADHVTAIRVGHAIRAAASRRVGVPVALVSPTPAAGPSGPGPATPAGGPSGPGPAITREREDSGRRPGVVVAESPAPADDSRPVGPRLRLTGVEARGCHGVLPGERVEPQRFSVDLTAWLPPVADRADVLAETVDYSRFSALIVEAVEHQSCQLIETLADRIARSALALGGIERVEVTVHKPEAPLAEPFADVAVTVGRSRGRPLRPVVFSLGSNLGDRAAWLQFGLTGLVTTPGVRLVAVSPVYEAEPVGVVGQPDYLNAAVVVESNLPAADLLARGLELERLAGRVRPPGPAPQHAARPLDIDLIVAGDETSATPRLMLPHPRAHKRAFVLAPWLDADPGASLAGRPLADWLDRITGQPLRRRDDLTLVTPARPGLDGSR